MDFKAALQSPDSIIALFKTYSVQPSDGTIPTDRVAFGRLRQTVGDEQRPIKYSLTFGPYAIKHLELAKSTTVAEQNAEYQAYVQQLLDKGKDLNKVKWFYALNCMQRELQKKYAPTNTIRGKDTLMTLLYDRERPTTQPCYFLPWDPMGGVVELEIPAKPADAPRTQHPILFLTAALSGCSIFIRGTPQNPTIYHCGTQYETPADQSAKHFWKEAMRALGVDPDDTAAIHNRDYLEPKRGKTGAGKEMADKARTMFANHYAGRLTIEDIRPWGAVFGVRRGNSWEFYLQENATIQYTSATHAEAPGGPAADIRIVSRPIVLRKIFPGGGGEVTLLRRWKKLRA